VAKRAFGIKTGDDGDGGTNSPDRVASRRTVGVSVIFPCTLKSRKWRAITELLNKGCSEFYETVENCQHTDSQSKALADFGCMLA